MFSFDSRDGGAIALILEGEVDIELARQINLGLDYHLSTARAFEIDAGAVSYIDSSGVSVLVHIMRSTQARKIPFHITRASAQLIRVLSLAQLDQLFTIVEYCEPAPEKDDDTALIEAIKSGKL